MKVKKENESEWKVVQTLLRKKRRIEMRTSQEKKENVRFVSEFVTCTRWDILIERQDKKKLMKLTDISKEKNSMKEILKISEKYFTKISNKFRIEDVLFRRKIESEEYDYWLTSINN